MVCKLLDFVIIPTEEFRARLEVARMYGDQEGFERCAHYERQKRKEKIMAEEIEETREEEQALDAPDWKNRFRLEYHEVKARYIKLHNIIVKLEAGTCEFKPNCSLDLLKRQAKVMGEYLFVLEIRAQIEKVVL